MSGNVSTTLSIKGMSCAGCARNIEEALSGTEGVSEVSVDLAGKSAHLTYDPEAVTPETFRRVIADLGYEVVSE